MACGKHLAPYPRRFPLLPEIETIGYVSRKTYRVEFVFSTCNFSFVLGGSGEYVLDGRRIPVHAPCVLLQWPGVKMDYGPVPGGAWEELYVIFPARFLGTFRGANVFAEPVRPFHRTPRFEQALESMKKLCAAPDVPASVADYADRLGWEMIGASFESDAGLITGTVEPALSRIRDKIESGARGGLTEFAAESGMSVSTLRRRWRDAWGEEPIGACRDAAFLRDGCRMLVETPCEIKEIAARLGFADVGYFCRKFRRKMGCTPTEYRTRHRLPSM